ncbi:MAG: hypothetical protein DI598_20825 [Pseudopedobacter saltans]|uniref:Uncharacterized protein n=1 Tax=Pseudopedobacter saltans TaxID=151895 RepID=A0A2W5E6Q4_9SPHI|nr:MAG: hypothetical protein DI598_20825 [Pseudopedobacter saltans]
MHITHRRGDEIYCSRCGKCWGHDEEEPNVCKPPAAVMPPENALVGKEIISPSPWQQKKQKRTETAMIGFLAAKLAIYEPNSTEVKKALEYLRCQM